MKGASPASACPPFPRVQGHRGCVYLEPENTLAGFQRSGDVGADAIELDVFLTADGELIVFHGGGSDGKAGGVEELTSGSGNCQEMNLKELMALEFKADAFSCPPERCVGQRIPTLRQALETCKRVNLSVTVELKGDGTEQGSLSVVKELDMLQQVNFSSFDWSRLSEVLRLEPKAEVALLFGERVPEDFVQRALDIGGSQVDLRYDIITDEMVSAAHAQGLKVMAWFRGPLTMDAAGQSDDQYFHRLLALGVDTICTNRPDMLSQLRQQHHKL